MELNCEPTPPDLDSLETFAPFTGGTPAIVSRFYETSFSDLAWHDFRISGVEFSRAVFGRVVLAKSRLRDSSFLDARIKLSDLSNADWIGIEMHRVELLSSRMTGFNGAEGKFRDALFQNCRADYAVFQSSQFERCRFEKCSLADATFESATLRNIVFRNCDLTNARFIGARIEEVDVRGSQIDGLAAAGSLKGLTIDVAQSSAIAALTGVRIADL